MAVFRVKYSGVSIPPFGSPGGNALNAATQRKTLFPTMNLGTWNVQSIYQAGKIHNVIQEMQRLRVNVLGLSETRWPGSGEIMINDMKMYFSGNSDSKHWNGVAIVVDKTTSRAVTSFVPISDRVLVIQIQATKVKVNIVQVYAPTADKSVEELDQFYDEVGQALMMAKPQDITVVMGDFNAKIGKGKEEDFIGEFGLGTRNERGERLAQFCQDEELVITNTYFKLPERRLYTWKSPADQTDNIVRNQIDYILINKRYRNSVLAVKTFPGADIGSDHNPLIARFRVKFKKLIRRQQMEKLLVYKLKNPVVREQLSEQINDQLRIIQNEIIVDVDEKWKNIKNVLLSTSRDVLKKDKMTGKKGWMTEDILRLMDMRRLYKNKDISSYNNINAEIRRKIRKAKEEWYSEKCVDIEGLDSKHDSFNLHRKVKELTGTYKVRKANVLKDKNGNIIPDVERRLDRWKEYIQELYSDEREDDLLYEEQQSDWGPEITKEEILHAVLNAKDNKAPGPDSIPSELLKLINQENIELLVDMFNTVYKNGSIPKEWLQSIFIPIPKKVNARECDDHRIISLLSHTLKIFLKIIHKRIYRKLEQDMEETQFGFRDALGTREALFSFNVLVQRCQEVKQPLYICFLDYNKAFDKVRHDLLFRLLKRKNLDQRDVNIIIQLYCSQTAIVREGNAVSEEIKIRRGVRQGCVLSPVLFNTYSEEVIQNVLSEVTAGIKVNGRLINNLRFADDTLLLAGSLEDLQLLIDRVVVESEKSGLTLNIKKTCFMVISKEESQGNLIINGEVIQRVHKCRYLGTIISDCSDCSQEIRARIGQARSAFNQMRNVLCSRDLSLDLRIRLLKCYVFSVLLYGMEAWTLKQDTINRLEAFEMWTYRRILRVSWIKKVTNLEILRRIGKCKEIINTVKIRKLQYLGHIIRGERYHLLQEIIQGKIEGRRSQGRRRISWLDNLKKWFNCSSSELFRAAGSKDRIAVMIANLLRGDGT